MAARIKGAGEIAPHVEFLNIGKQASTQTGFRAREEIRVGLEDPPIGLVEGNNLGIGFGERKEVPGELALLPDREIKRAVGSRELVQEERGEFSRVRNQGLSESEGVIG